MGKTAFIYPGQGSQKIGMGQDFYENSQAAREVYQMADEVLDVKVTSLCFEENDCLDQTACTQPALVTTCLAITKELEKRGIFPDVTAGLSLGEYAALAAAGGCSYEDAIKTVRKRGIYMEEAVPQGGAMAAVLGMDAEKIESILSGIQGATIANYNCPGQIVITGMTDSVQAAMDQLKEAGAKRCIPLTVSGPFHSPYLKGAGEKLGKELEKITILPLKIPYVTNVTAEFVEDSSETKELLIRQVSSSVKWEQSVRNMIADGVDTFVEIGPGKTLTGFIKKINREVQTYTINTMADIPETL